MKNKKKSENFTQELRKEAAGMHHPFYVSISCGHPILEVTKVSDKMQTKLNKKTQDRCPRSLKSLYNGGVSTNAKVVISFEKLNIEYSIDPLINQSAHPDMLLLCHYFEFVPGLLVNGDDHLHPLVLGIYRFPTTPRSCTSPCFLFHN